MFSVIIPLFNKKETILNTISSVLNQSFGDFEIIVVDDGSTDRGVEIVSSVLDDRIKLISKLNGGVSDARNFGIAKSTKRYIAFLDGDDLWDPDYLDEMNRMITKYPECGMYNSGYRAIRNGKIVFQSSKDEIRDEIITDYFNQSLNRIISWTSATIIDRNVFLKVGFFPVGMVSGEDTYMWTKVAKVFPVAYNHKVMVSYILDLSNYFNRRGKMDSCKERWQDLIEPENDDLNYFLASKGIAMGIRYAWRGNNFFSKIIEQDFMYARKVKQINRKWKKLFIINRIPNPIIRVCLLVKRTIQL